MEREVPILLEENHPQVLLQRLRTAEEHGQRLVRDSLQDIPDIRPSRGVSQRNALQQRDRLHLQVLGLRIRRPRALRRQFAGIGLLGELCADFGAISEGAEEMKRAERRLLAAREHDPHGHQMLHLADHADHRDLHAPIALFRSLQRVQQVQNIRRHRGEPDASAHEQHVLSVRLHHSIEVLRPRDRIRLLQQVERGESHRNALVRHGSVVLHAERALDEHAPLLSLQILPRDHARLPQPAQIPVPQRRARPRPHRASLLLALMRPQRVPIEQSRHRPTSMPTLLLTSVMAAVMAAVPTLRLVLRQIEQLCSVLRSVAGRAVRQPRELPRPGVVSADDADVEDEMVLHAVGHRHRVGLQQSDARDIEIDDGADEPADGSPREKAVAERHVQNDEVVVDLDFRDAGLASDQREPSHAEIRDVEREREPGEEVEPRGVEEKDDDEDGSEELVGEVEDLPEAAMDRGERGESEEGDHREAPEEDLGGSEEAEAR